MTASATCAASSPKLDYLEELGVDVVWLSPVYKSPNDDNGYDISDYQDIMDEFGTLADWEELLAELHARGIRLVMDLVVNHTSDEHPWFVEVAQIQGQPVSRLLHLAARPRTVTSRTTGIRSSAARPGSTTRRRASTTCISSRRSSRTSTGRTRRSATQIYDMMRWWLDKGIDGFRMDVITMISKAPGLPDAPVTRHNPLPVGAASTSSTARACWSS